MVDPDPFLKNASKCITLLDTKSTTHTIAWICRAGNHIQDVNVVTAVTGAEVGPNCVVTDGFRAADGDVFETLINICPERYHIFYMNFIFYHICPLLFHIW